jgi:aquaporin Z
MVAANVVIAGIVAMPSTQDKGMRDQNPAGDWHVDHPGGVHLSEWAAEGAGTAILLLVVVSVVSLVFGPGSPVAGALPARSPRLLLAGLLIAGSASLVAVSPLGRLSGGHINPAVTFAFWLTGHVHHHDLAGYVGAQLLGAIAGVGVGALLWGSRAVAVQYGRTTPGPGVGDLGAGAIEMTMTATLLLVIFTLTSRQRLMRYTPLVTWLLVASLVWRLAPLTGTSLNPARSLSPAVFARTFDSLAVYLVAPLLGAALAALMVRLRWLRLPLTAKLFHDPDYRSVTMTMMPSQGKDAAS